MKYIVFFALLFFGCQKEEAIVENVRIGDCWEHVQLSNGQNLSNFDFENYWFDGTTKMAFLWDCRFVAKDTLGDIVYDGQWMPKDCLTLTIFQGEEGNITNTNLLEIELITDDVLQLRGNQFEGLYQKINR